MAGNDILVSGGNMPVYDTAQVVGHINKLLAAVNVNTYATIGDKEDEEISYPYTIFEIDVESVGDTQRAEGYYLDLELFDRSGSYAALYELDATLRSVLDKARILTDGYWYMIKWNRTNSVPTEQRGLLRLAVQFYIKAETRKRV